MVVNNILLNKLFIYGIRGTAFNLIKNYLSEREQYVGIYPKMVNYPILKWSTFKL